MQEKKLYNCISGFGSFSYKTGEKLRGFQQVELQLGEEKEISFMLTERNGI